MDFRSEEKSSLFMNTGRVIRDVNADILAVVEAEHRVALKQFSDFVLAKVGGTPYSQVMLIDGNDDRGIDVALMTKVGYDIGTMVPCVVTYMISALITSQYIAVTVLNIALRLLERNYLETAKSL